jgi:hypothetical protein
MIEEFKEGGYVLYSGRWPLAQRVGDIRPDGAVIDGIGVQRYQVIDDKLWAMSELLAGEIHQVGSDWYVTDDQHNCLYTIRRES